MTILLLIIAILILYVIVADSLNTPRRRKNRRIDSKPIQYHKVSEQSSYKAVLIDLHGVRKNIYLKG